MDVLMFTPEYHEHVAGGIEKLVHDLSESLAQHNLDVKICSPSGPDVFIGSNGLIHNFGGLGLMYYWLRVWLYFLKNERSIPVILHDPLFLFGAPFSKTVSVIHTTYLGFYRTSKINSYGILKKLYYKLMSSIERIALRNLNKKDSMFIAISPQIKNELLDYGIDSERIVVVPNGVDTKLFAPVKQKGFLREKWGIPKDKTVLITVGRMIPEKNHEGLLRLFSSIENDANVFLVIVGDGALYKKTNELVKELKIKNVKLFGYVDNKELPELYSASDIYITLSKYEGHPLTVLEAMSCGIPVTAPDTVLFNYFISKNNGLLIKPDSQDSIKELLDYIDKASYTQQGAYARNYVKKHFDLDVVSKRYLEVFFNVFKKND